MSHPDLFGRETELIFQQFNAAQAAERFQMERSRPFMLLRPKVFPDGNQWCALYGENTQEGVAGFGDTPSLAALDFDKNWYGQKLRIQK